ncbi:MAG: acyltransferase domain-containing protein, partial [bacterium]|nr:acyltransferase domain-containing protein [bacterium]
YTAACLSGVFSLEDGIKLVVLRGKLMQQTAGGAMLGVPLSKESLIPLLQQHGQLELAAENAPSLCVVSGPRQAIKDFELQWQKQEKQNQCRRLHTSHAFHSRLMDPILAEFQEKIKKIPLNKPGIPYISNTTGRWITVQDAMDPGYWSRHVRKPVLFMEGISELLKEENACFIEIGPGPALTGLLKQHPNKKTTQPVVNLVRHPKKEVSDSAYLLNRIGQLWLWGQIIDVEGFYADQRCKPATLPTYPFERQRYWLEAQEDLLPKPSVWTKKSDLSQWFYIPSWKRFVAPWTQTGKKLAQKWLLFMDAQGIGTQLLKRLHQDRRDVITVEPGDQFKVMDT